MEADGPSPLPPATTGPWSPLLGRLRPWLPAPRLLWIALAAVGAVAVAFLGEGLGASSLLVLPILAAGTDLLFQRFRHPKLRAPDSAIATGLFLALLFPPMVPLAAAGAAAFGAIGLRHVLRARGRPWFNPAAVGLLLGALAFGLAPAWWGAVYEPGVIGAGAIVLLWNLPRWRVPAAFFGAFAGLSTLGRVLAFVGTGTSTPFNLPALAIVDPTVLFFGLLMVTEPRSAPADKRLGAVYGAAIALLAFGLAYAAPTLALPLALLGGNAIALGIRLRRIRPREWAAEESARSRAVAPSSPWKGGVHRWSTLRRLTAGLGVSLVIIVSAAAIPLPADGPPAISSGTGGPRPGAVPAVTLCLHDSPVVNHATLHSLHRALGPSVIIIYQRTTGIVVYYDPVHHQTVRETDLYQDFGYAEFDTHDARVPGCVA
ncbi:MAG: RnfABCDGE type electron transport complex subunit D [Thermoplasmata archaeon]|nr:RnfABCDGE type electron transport complex subunit D [Thermoplasmata archaeon]